MPKPRRPQPEKLHRLNDMPGYLLRRANQLIVAHFNEACADHEITPVQFAAMSAIASAGRIDVTRLSALVSFDKATLGSVVDRLEKRGLVRRLPHPEDRRIKLVELTDAGEKLLDLSWPDVARSQVTFLSTLDPDERATLLRLLRKVSGLPDPDDGPTEPAQSAANA